MRKNENGRSMVEMLGVLAIIGVLSVGGIYGYTSAMTKYKANEVAQTLSALAMEARTANGGEGKDLAFSSSSMKNQKPAGLALTATAYAANKGSSDDAIAVKMEAPAPTTDTVGKAVCSIVPKTQAKGKEAGYYVCGCTGGDECPTATP